MSKSEEAEENWSVKMDDICFKLNVDAVAAKKSKEAFGEIQQNFTLEGDPQHWMACALYVACRTSITPTVQTFKAVEGNCVSLTRLLRLCNLSIIQFFIKIKQWSEMASLSNEFRDRISRLEKKFAVSTVLFRKFQPIFQEIFSGLTNEPVKNNTKSKKPKLQKCTTNALFEFTWCLYVCVKGEFHTHSADDLVDMYHALLSCLDFVFANAFMSRRTDLINPSFKGLPANWWKDDFELPKKPPCIISTLCELKDGLVVEAAAMKQYSWKPVIKSFFEKGILKGNDDQLTGLLEVGNFEINLKSLNNLYETYVLSVGEFDERIFLGEHANEQIGTKKVSGDEISKVIATFGPNSRACPDTPLTGRRYLASREPLTPVSEATVNRERLNAYLRLAQPQPSAPLRRLFAECGVSDETIEENVVQPCNKWSGQLHGSLSELHFSEDMVTYRCNMVTCLYYKVFEQIIREEHRKKPQVSLQMLARQEGYQLALYACCTEVILHAYGINALRFPRVLRVYGLSALHFYKIIELAVQALVDKLSRDLIKHLNAVEEEVLESLVWTSDSPLWEYLSRTSVPASTDVSIQESPHFRRQQIGFQSPASHAGDRHVTSPADQARKQLFKDNIKPGQSLLVAPTSVTVKSEPNTPQTTVNHGQSSSDTTPTSTPRKANNSLALFFRKFYSLAVVRMNDLCTRLRLVDEELKRKIWTCLEHSIMHQTHLMRDRHLDQILMCAVYVICKVSNSASNQVERTFADIMRCYRQRPLADSHVYRSVLIKQSEGQESPERGDLINFYNQVYVQCMQNFALRFTGRHRDECSLSPLPAARGEAGFSPGGPGQRVSERHQLYVKPLPGAPPALAPPLNNLTYRFSRSPAKDLQAINTMVSCEVGGVKRAAGPAAAAAAAGGGGGGELVKRARYAAAGGVARKLQGLMSDRQAV